MTSGNRAGAAMAENIEMPAGEMTAPPGPTVDMPSGEMPGEEVVAFAPATGEMPGGGRMQEPAGGILAGMAAGFEAAALAEMPGGGMAGVEAARAPQGTIELVGTWRLLVTSSAFKGEGGA